MTQKNSAPLNEISAQTYASEGPALAALLQMADLSPHARQQIVNRACQLITEIRPTDRPGLMEVFLAEYGLSSNEGVALMCLAEALLRVPDAATIDALIEDKIAPSNWGTHLGHSSSSLVNASTWALALTGKVLDQSGPGVAGHLHALVKRLGEPVIRIAVAQAMKEMGRQFVLGESIAAAMSRANGMESKGYCYSYDMLGEAARTAPDAANYSRAYAKAITAISRACTATDIRNNPGISIKLSALHPRYEVAQSARVMRELVPEVHRLALLAKNAGMGLNIDAEEADRLNLSLKVIEAVLSQPDLAGWDGFGVVVQAYSQRAPYVLDWLHDLATRLDRNIMVRLVKGAYWDSEIKQAQVEGLDGFPVFTRKASTDLSYIANARKLLAMTDRIYPQFATHNAHTVAAILEMATDKSTFEFQRLHGMGERLHELVKDQEGTRCRIYAPVGAHRDLLAYLVRRLLENGANSSFVNQIVDEDVSPETVAADPLADVNAYLEQPQNPLIPVGPALFGKNRANAKGWDLAHGPTLAALDADRGPFAEHLWMARPRIAQELPQPAAVPVCDPNAPATVIGHVHNSTTEQITSAITQARIWDAPAQTRARVLNHAADLFEKNAGQIFALLAREAGKTQADAISELREAVDFLRYYAGQAATLAAPAVGIFTCISPWNFPLAIFTGQIAAALAAGNGVLAKPAGQTPLIADLAVNLLHQAGVPVTALQCLPGDGATVGAALTSDPRIDAVVFTGSTATAQTIRRAMADNLKPGAPMIAETGGLNAMIIDSTALPEQAVADVVQSAFQSAGQRCSALRCLYLQSDIAETFLRMLFGAMDELALAAPWHLSTDVGPVIDALAQEGIQEYVDEARSAGRVLKELTAPASGYFIAPVAIKVDGIGQMKREVFGPVLHIATFDAADLDQTINDINGTGYGLTFGLHSRIDDRVQHVVDRIDAGNIYINRNQIGAVVGSQPFGGEGLSGTGPKAGGPNYLGRFTKKKFITIAEAETPTQSIAQIQALIDANPSPKTQRSSVEMPGPTGESNRLSLYARAPLLCLGPGGEATRQQIQQVTAFGGIAVAIPEGLKPKDLQQLTGFSGVIYWGPEPRCRAFATALAAGDGAILPLIRGPATSMDVLFERHLCIDTTAAGGNAALLASAGEA